MEWATQLMVSPEEAKLRREDERGPLQIIPEVCCESKIERLVLNGRLDEEYFACN